MSSTGWIKVYRSLSEHWILNHGQKSWGEAWIDLLMMASFKAHKVSISNQLIVVQKGEVITSILKLQTRWHRGRKWVNNFLRSLEQDHMISQKRNKRFSVITICNYSKYQQDEEIREPTEVHTEEPTEEHRRNQLRDIEGTTINKGKERKERKNKPCEAKIATRVREVFKHWQLIMNKPDSKLDGKRRRKVEARLKEGHSVEDLKQAIEGCAKSKFHLGANDESKIYNDLELICRDTVHVERFMGFTQGAIGKATKNDDFYKPQEYDKEKYRRSKKTEEGVREMKDVLRNLI